ncbi:MAG TPA: hypothetical protein VHE35_08325 [Kofleriaceae bacterium]|nr:hypothetical protein [Kofleriaceae bacterium]
MSARGGRMLIDEHIRADSRRVRTWLRPVDAGAGAAGAGAAAAAAPGAESKIAVEVGLDDERPELLAALSGGAVAHVLRHYGKPLDDDVLAQLADAERIPLGGGLELARLRWRAAVDASGRDWLVLVTPGAEPVAALAPGVAGALRYIAAGRAQP